MIQHMFKKVNVPSTIRSFQQMKAFRMPQKVSPGRWTIETCEKKIFTKTDSSNEDHCGVCDKKIESYSQVQEDDDETLKYYLL